MSFKAGAVIGPYEITEIISTGGMATVYKASQPRLGRYVAMKVMHEMFLEDETFLARFEREARIVAQLDHPNIVPLYDFAEHEARPYLVMKFVEGLTLKDLLKRNRLEPEEILDILDPIAKALQYAHQQGVLHRDVKPSNIILDRRGVPYLMDFGLARITQAGESTISANTMLGTPHYISPEQASGENELDARTDVYSLGVVLYELVAGRVPFSAENSHAIINDHIHTPPPPASELNVPPEVEAVLDKALAKRPENRYTTPVDLLVAYRSAVEGEAADEEPSRTLAERVRRGQNRASFQPGLPPKDSSFVKQNAGDAFSEEPDDDYDVSDDGAMLPVEERLRQRAEKRVRERREALGRIGGQLVGFIFINFVIFSAGDWLGAMIDESRLMAPPFILWFTFIFWGFGIFGQVIDYYNKYGPGRERREREIEREIERERRRYYGSSAAKRKNDEPPLRLTEDGELSESFVDDWEQQKRNK